MTAAVAAGRTEGFALGLALSAFDAAMTWLWLTLGIATEGNPVIANLIETQGLTTAMGIRAGLGIVWFAGFHWLAKRSRLAHPAQMMAFVILGTLALYHLGIGARLLG